MSSYKDDNDPVGKLMHDFRCISSVDMFYPILAKQVKYFKVTERGQKIMCQVFEDLAEKRVTEGKKAFARRLIARGKQTKERVCKKNTDYFQKNCYRVGISYHSQKERLLKEKEERFTKEFTEKMMFFILKQQKRDVIKQYGGGVSYADITRESGTKNQWFVRG